MSKFTLYTHSLGDQEKKQLKEELIKGNLVCVSPTCVNPEKAKRIKYHANQYMEELGAHLVHEEVLESNKFYGLVENYPDVLVRLSDVQAILDDNHWWLNGVETRAMLGKIAQFDKYGNMIKEEQT